MHPSVSGTRNKSSYIKCREFTRKRDVPTIRIWMRTLKKVIKINGNSSTGRSGDSCWLKFDDVWCR